MGGPRHRAGNLILVLPDRRRATGRRRPLLPHGFQDGRAGHGDRLGSTASFRHEGKDCGPGGPPTATEWTIEPRRGGRCLVRVVHSLFAGLDDWDDQLESFEAGWPQCLAIMRLYLGHFRGQRVSIARAISAVDGSAQDAWEALLGELGARGLSPGDRWAFAVSGAAGLIGVFEESRPGRQPYAVIRLDQPGPGTAALSAYKIGERATVALSIYFYGDEAPRAAARDEAGWQAWMEGRFR